jgi:predicted DNA-binding WGR domain protein
MESLRRLWKKPTERGFGFNEIQLHQDLWGQWTLTRVWGQRGTALGQNHRITYRSYGDAMAQEEQISRRRLQHGLHSVQLRRPDR